jgi:TolA-binding protein
MIRNFRRYLPYIVGALFAVLILILAITWFKQASAMEEVAAWVNITAVTPEDLALIADDYPSSSAAPWALFRRTQLLLEQARYQDLISTVRRIEAEYPSHPALAGAHLFLGKTYWEMDELEKAVEVFQSSTLMNSHYAADAAWYAALCSEMLGDLDEAEKLYQKLSADHPGRYWGELASLRLARLGTDLKPLSVITGSAEPPESVTEAQ